MNAYKGIADFFKDNLFDKAKEYQYSESNIFILQNNFVGLASKHGQQYRNIVHCTNQMDGREPLEYARDIVATWIFEDYMLEVLQNDYFEIKLGGADKVREFLPNEKVKYDSDFIIVHKDKRYKLELVTNYTDFWDRQKKIHLRCKKYDSLIKEKAILLGIGLTSKNFLTIDFENPPKAKYISQHKYTKKPAQEIEIRDKIQLRNFCTNSIIEELHKIIKLRIENFNK